MGKIRKKQNCRLCGREFIPRQRGTHYCDGCRERVLDAYKAYLEAGEPMQKYCMICGSKIENKLFRSKTVCSRGCSCTLYSLTKSWWVANGRSKLKQTAPAPAARKNTPNAATDGLKRGHGRNASSLSSVRRMIYRRNSRLNRQGE